jgi:hypothetical protein
MRRVLKRTASNGIPCVLMQFCVAPEPDFLHWSMHVNASHSQLREQIEQGRSTTCGTRRFPRARRRSAPSKHTRSRGHRGISTSLEARPHACSGGGVASGAAIRAWSGRLPTKPRTPEAATSKTGQNTGTIHADAALWAPTVSNGSNVGVGRSYLLCSAPRAINVRTRSFLPNSSS